MSTPYLFDNAVLDRHAKLANGLPVEGEFEFADRLWLLARSPASDVDGDDRLLDTFLDRRNVYAPVRTEAGGIRIGLAVIVLLVAAGFFGWTHSSAAPNGATLLAIEVLAVVIAVPTIVIKACRRADRRAAAYTARVEGHVQQDTTGDHIWDA